MFYIVLWLFYNLCSLNELVIYINFLLSCLQRWVKEISLLLSLILNCHFCHGLPFHALCSTIFTKVSFKILIFDYRAIYYSLLRKFKNIKSLKKSVKKYTTKALPGRIIVIILFYLSADICLHCMNCHTYYILI